MDLFDGKILLIKFLISDFRIMIYD